MTGASVVPIDSRRPRRCVASTRTGAACRNGAAQGSDYCRIHGPAPRSPHHVDAVAPDSVGQALEFLRRRLRGDYEVDEYGFDRELSELLLPLSAPATERYWRVEAIGTDRIPSSGPALLVANHAGTLPLDGFVLRSLVWRNPPHRHARLVMADLGFELPFLSHLARKTGATVACPDDARRLLESGELVGVFPEGYKGVGKGWRDRYRLQRFGRGGFVETAILAQAPIVPVAIVGSEEIYPMIADLRPLARLFGLPYFPVTPFFPLLGLLGLVPLPCKWIVEFGEPMTTSHLGRSDARDPMVVLDVADQVRHRIQQTLLDNLRRRRTIFG